MKQVENFSGAEQLRIELDSIKLCLDLGVSLPDSQSMISRCAKISSDMQASDTIMNVNESMKLFLRAENYIFRFLLEFPDHYLPDVVDIEKGVFSPVEDRVKKLDELRQKYPFCVRSVHNPHLYLPLLTTLEKTYGESNPSVQDMWKHEVGHFSRYLSQPNSLNYTSKDQNKTEFLAIVFKLDDYVAYQPAIIQDDSQLSIVEKKLVTEDLDELSIGDAVALEQLRSEQSRK